jgi:hypothetical protein
MKQPRFDGHSERNQSVLKGESNDAETARPNSREFKIESMLMHRSGMIPKPVYRLRVRTDFRQLCRHFLISVYLGSFSVHLLFLKINWLNNC